jgi:RNase P/RNase MRP subunit p29
MRRFGATVGIAGTVAAFVLIAGFIYAQRQGKAVDRKSDAHKTLVLRVEFGANTDLTITGLDGKRVEFARKILIERDEQAKRVVIVLNDSVTRTFEFTAEEGLRKRPFHWDAIEPVKEVPQEPEY